MKNTKGITLIALVVTIIILIILAAVSLNMLLGDSGIISKASESSKNTKMESGRELIGMAAMASYDNEGKISFSQLETELDKIDGIGYNKPIEKLPLPVTLYGYEYEIDGTGRVNDKGEEVEEEVTGTTIIDAVEANTIKVGDYVKYTPTSYTFKWTDMKDGHTYQEYSGSTTNTGTISTETNLNWRVLSVNNGKVMLISERPTSAQVTIYGMSGYLNNVKLLDDLCAKLYSGKRGTARNLKVLDFKSFSGNVGSYTWEDYFADKHEDNPENVSGTRFTDKQSNYTLERMPGETVMDEVIDYWTHSTLIRSNEFESSIYHDLLINSSSPYSSYWLSTRNKYWEAGVENSQSVFFQSNYIEPNNNYYLVDEITHCIYSPISRSWELPEEGDTHAMRPVVLLNANAKVDVDDITKDGSSLETAWVIK